MTHSGKYAGLLLLTLVAGCSTLGDPYPSPKPGEPSAEVEVRGGPVYLLTVNDKGCYRGKTLVDGRDGAAPVKVKPDTRLILSYEGTCLMTLGFTPQQDGRYRIMAAERRKPSDPDEPFWKAIGALRMQQCMVAVRDISAGEDAPVPVKPKELSPKQSGITCIRFREP